ncbi:hypothetical protein Hbl1158_07740 [Halobaculum sp. CBA1158]|uniref:hypothetical protein n=1 Tax=Halobaculum sp. CBA1158 TaxID=2904243 RepID=UPI001F1E184E|nr:hypothetical protein [Halobaculum sp. CBA1158]UIO98457.1 hypothetical protein Hbl1158_07740 [Halobaculum sp. CBA1158]
MSDRSAGIRLALARPATASFGTRSQRTIAALTVGVLAGVLGATATYTLRLQTVAPAWAGETAMGALVLVSGAFVKLLCQELRTSVLALVVAVVSGGVLAFAAAVAPYLLLDISTLGGIALLPTFRDVITFLVFGQVPLQLTGYLVAIVYDGMTA